MNAPIRPGAIVGWWKDNTLAFGVVAGEEKQRLRLIAPRGKEERVKPSRVECEVEAPGAVPGRDPSERREAGERVTRCSERVGQQAESIEVGLVWEIVSEGTEPDDEPSALSLLELAELALESRAGQAQAAVIVALLADGLHFSRKGSEWQARSASSVEAMRRERALVQQRANQTTQLFAALEAARRGVEFCERGNEVERRFLDALHELALNQEGTRDASRAMALQALDAAGQKFDRPHEGAFRLLRRLGRFDSDEENLQLLRYGLRPEFPAEVLEQASLRVERGFDAKGRRRLTDLRAFSIDGVRTREIDDALSIEAETDGGWRLGVHIADPGVFVDPGDSIDREAEARALTYYMPDVRVPMLPPVISEDAASLLADAERPALSFLIRLDAAGGVDGFEIVASVVRCVARLDYDEADRLASGGEGAFAAPLRELVLAADARQRARVHAGAVLILAPETEVYVDPDGLPRLERSPADSPSRRAVTEAMVLAGQVAAMFCRDASLPVIYRRQPASDSLAARPAEGVSDAVAVRQLRMTLQRAEVGLEAGRHASLGLEAYTQVTSPIRRFQDLVSHRQIQAALCGRRPCYDLEAMRRILASTEQAEADARRAERSAAEYWLLRYLESRLGDDIEARVVQVEPRPVVQLVETLREQPMPSLTGRVELGQQIRVRIERINPRAGLLTLRRTD